LFGKEPTAKANEQKNKRLAFRQRLAQQLGEKREFSTPISAKEGSIRDLTKTQKDFFREKKSLKSLEKRRNFCRAKPFRHRGRQAKNQKRPMES